MAGCVAVYSAWQLTKIACAFTAIVLGKPNPAWLNRLLRR